MKVEERQFPIMQGGGEIASIPWRVIQPHEPQAMSNHGRQTLERLAERKGLCPSECYYVLNDLPFNFHNPIEQGLAVNWLRDNAEAT